MEGFLETVEMVRRVVPDVALSTDIIVGFPGETEAEFEKTLEIMRTVQFDEAFTYKYSIREGTPATRFPPEDFLPDNVAQARLETLIRVARRVQGEINRREIGRVEEVLIENVARNPGQLRGRTRRNKVVAFPQEEKRIGEYVAVELTGTSGATFSGELREAATLVATT